MAPSRIPSPLIFTSDEKLCPAVILTPSSPIDQTDYQILVMPVPPKRRRGPLELIRSWRSHPAAIQLPPTPNSADLPSFQVTVISVESDKNRRRCKLLLLLSIPLVLLLIHFLLAMMQLSTVHAESGGRSDSVWEPILSLFGFGTSGREHHAGHGLYVDSFEVEPTITPAGVSFD